ncbi:hypothetical protein GCM10008965_55300 [Methylorubrum aminovorans]|nr:hypothetical protein GCM10025880_32950 [Methylorubrum aminovorans]
MPDAGQLALGLPATIRTGGQIDDDDALEPLQHRCPSRVSLPCPSRGDPGDGCPMEGTLPAASVRMIRPVGGGRFGKKA